MKGNILFEYMQNRFEVETSRTKTEKKDNKIPFITISRQFGCPSKLVTNALNKKINEYTTRHNHKSWSIINKEILEQAAKKLELHPNKINYIFDAESKNTMDEILSALSSKRYKSDRTKRKIIRDIVMNIALEGRKIIIGRGGVSITNTLQNSLHIRLFAPLEWRIEQVKNTYSFPTTKKAIEYILEMDKKRLELIKQFYPYEFSFEIFDLQYNCRKIKPEEIAEQIFHLLLERKAL
ncbi:MAG: cytidylate kinase family protein [Bacteroidota bacterium]|nr:cytidylate kinase family protein [Bacteroidota bacterium]